MADLAPHVTVSRMPLAMPAVAIRHVAEPEILATEEVLYVGQPIAVVVAESRALAEDAAGAIELEIEPLPAVADARTALDKDAPPADTRFADNLAAQFTMGYGDVDAAFAAAAHVVSLDLDQHKCGGHPMECRGMLAEYDAALDALTVWDGTQMPHRAREIIVKVLGWSEDRVRVICPDVGGGFGPEVRDLQRGDHDPAGGLSVAAAGEVDRGPARAFHRHDDGARSALACEGSRR